MKFLWVKIKFYTYVAHNRSIYLIRAISCHAKVLPINIACLRHSSPLMYVPKAQLACTAMPIWDYYFVLANMLVANTSELIQSECLQQLFGLCAHNIS